HDVEEEGPESVRDRARRRYGTRSLRNAAVVDFTESAPTGYHPGLGRLPGSAGVRREGKASVCHAPARSGASSMSATKHATSPPASRPIQVGYAPSPQPLAKAIRLASAPGRSKLTVTPSSM